MASFKIKYTYFHENADNVRIDYLYKNYKRKELSEKYQVPENILQQWIHKYGLAGIRRELKRELSNKAKEATKASIEEVKKHALTLNEKEKNLYLKKTEVEIDKHNEWGSNQLETSKERLNSDYASMTHLGTHLSNVEKINKLHKEIYGLSKQESNQHMRDVSFLINFSMPPKEKEAVAKEI